MAGSLPHPQSQDLHQLTIRPMHLEDIPQVLSIDLLSFSLPWSERSYRYELTDSPTTLALVMERNAASAIIGMSVTWVIVDEAHIATIAIHPDYRGLGLGKRMLLETLLRAYQRGARMATLEVRAGNSIAQQMYAAFGFTIKHRRAQYYRDNNEDALLMTLNKLEPEKLPGMSR